MLGKVFALCNADEQAQFLNEAGKSLRLICKVNEGMEDMQILRIAELLGPDGKNLIIKLAAAVEEANKLPF